MPFMRLVYESLFPGKKLANKPKAWRIQFRLEVVYGGWTMVRTVVKTGFLRVKDVQYDVLLNFVIDEYFVEFAHSMARRSTNQFDNVEQLRQKMFSLFVSGERQANFRAAFTPSKNYVFSRRQLTALHSKVASIIVGILTSITNSPNSAVLLPRAPGQRKDLWKLPALFGDFIIPLILTYNPINHHVKNILSTCHFTTPVQPAQPSLRTQTQTSQPPPPSQSSSQWKPPHCSTCGHTLQGHKRLVLMEASGKSCPLRPSKVCTREGRSTSCACHWCTRQPPTIPANKAFSSFSQVPCVVRETHKSRCN
ncbi:unnamed protein product [Porites lobata]|uniref:Uncharacterized protein n=1 Tax=Porites lobata TaxID=104759 RepID=A0ABN8PVR2_9CNID|nr:unnamed protein product [Porites lobata]